ncbi:MAG TPA: hypothetical protein VH813_07895, partial [Candidatus Limnocylindrales bacterium]
AWDDAAEAAEFADAATVRLDASAGEGSVVHQPGEADVTVLLGSDTGAAVSLDRIFGHTGV